MTSSVIFSAQLGSASTIETSGQPLTVTEFIHVTEVSAILSLHEVIDILLSFVTQTTSSIFSSIFFSFTSVSSSAFLSVVILSPTAPTLLNNNELVATIMLLSSSPSVSGLEKKVQIF